MYSNVFIGDAALRLVWLIVRIIVCLPNPPSPSPSVPLSSLFPLELLFLRTFVMPFRRPRQALSRGAVLYKNSRTDCNFCPHNHCKLFSFFFLHLHIFSPQIPFPHPFPIYSFVDPLHIDCIDAFLLSLYVILPFSLLCNFFFIFPSFANQVLLSL